MEQSTECLSQEDQDNLKKISEAKKDAQTNAEMAFLKNENLELKYRLFVSQIFKKYNLKDDDQILDDGTFKRSVEEEIGE